MTSPGPLTALYVPGSRPDRFDKAAASGADAVILDLEDSVAPGEKAAAREAVRRWLGGHPELLEPGGPEIGVQVRINAPGSGDHQADLAALPAAVAVRVPKVHTPADLAQCAGRNVHVLLESALGVEHAFDLARQPGVCSLGLGEADLAGELGLSGDAAWGWIRSRVVVAARAAGLPAPMMAAYPQVEDVEGLAASCAVGRSLGMRGRAAVHPRQLPVIREAFAPTDAEAAWAREVLDAVGAGGVARLADGSMVDAAMARRARIIVGQDVG